MNAGLRPLKIGLLLDDWEVPSWIASIVWEICASGTADIVAVATVCHSNNTSPQTRGLPGYQAPSRLSRLGQLYLCLDHLFSRPVPDALEPVNLKSLLDQCPPIRIEAGVEGPYFRFNEIDAARLRKLDLDVLLLFCDRLPTPQTLSPARYGIWSFLDHERLVTGRAPIGFWEVLERRPVMRQSLHAYLPGSERPLILHEYAGLTNRRSITRARNNYLWKSASFVNRKLQALQRGESLRAISSPRLEPGGPSPEQEGSNLRIAKDVLGHVSRCVKDLIDYSRYVNQWIMGYKFGGASRMIDDDLSEFRWLVPPKDRIWADPFPVQHDGRYFLFFEECLAGRNEKGYLCVAPLDQNGFSEAPRIILKGEHHLSYPFVFFWQGDWYLIPESQESNRVDVYKFEKFPSQVRFHKTILENIQAADVTIFEMDGQWWMFAGVAVNGTYNVDELFLFHSHHPFGPWVPHPQNPIKSDVRSSRPAGNIFSWDGRYYRPAQDCSKGYGYSVRFHEINILNKEQFAETEAGVLAPDSAHGLRGIHTFNRAGDLTVIDGKKWRRRTYSELPAP